MEDDEPNGYESEQEILEHELRVHLDSLAVFLKQKIAEHDGGLYVSYNWGTGGYEMILDGQKYDTPGGDIAEGTPLGNEGAKLMEMVERVEDDVYAVRTEEKKDVRWDFSFEATNMGEEAVVSVNSPYVDLSAISGEVY